MFKRARFASKVVLFLVYLAANAGAIKIFTCV
jgi:TLC domain